MAERNFVVECFNFPDQKQGTVVSLETVEKYFNVNHALNVGWISEVKEEVGLSFLVDAECKTLYLSDLIFFVDTRNGILHSGYFELTKEFFANKFPDTLKLFYDEKSQMEFIASEIKRTLSDNPWMPLEDQLRKKSGTNTWPADKKQPKPCSSCNEKNFSLNDLRKFIKDAPGNNGSRFASKMANDIIDNALMHTI